MNNKKYDWQEAEALRRYQVIAPLLDAEMDPAKKLQLRAELAEKHETSTRTLYRYENAYRSAGFTGLKPADRTQTRSKNLPENFDELLQEDIQLKREVPKRSFRQIIRILELEGRVAPGKLKRPTLERYLYDAGFGVRQMQMYKDARKSSSKRFCKPNRMMLVQGDIKYGLKLPIGKNGAKVQTYLSSAIDDHSRFILASRFYDNQEEEIVEDTFHQVIDCYGKFDACYFDHGSQYVAKQLNLSLSKLGITIRDGELRDQTEQCGADHGRTNHRRVPEPARNGQLRRIQLPRELDNCGRGRG